jgi:hypothetical protein
MLRYISKSNMRQSKVLALEPCMDQESRQAIKRRVNRGKLIANLTGEVFTHNAEYRLCITTCAERDRKTNPKRH